MKLPRGVRRASVCGAGPASANSLTRRGVDTDGRRVCHALYLAALSRSGRVRFETHGERSYWRGNMKRPPRLAEKAGVNTAVLLDDAGGTDRADGNGMVGFIASQRGPVSGQRSASRGGGRATMGRRQ